MAEMAKKITLKGLEQRSKAKKSIKLAACHVEENPEAEMDKNILCIAKILNEGKRVNVVRNYDAFERITDTYVKLINK